jgi:drug/metabolite transporter (DMT)-like permease
VNLFEVNSISATPVGVALAVASGAIATGFGYIAWFMALRHLPAARAATIQLSMPVLVALGGIGFLSEPLTPRLVLASVAMLAGLSLVLGHRIEKPGP